MRLPIVALCGASLAFLPLGCGGDPPSYAPPGARAPAPPPDSSPEMGNLTTKKSKDGTVEKIPVNAAKSKKG